MSGNSRRVFSAIGIVALAIIVSVVLFFIALALLDAFPEYVKSPEDFLPRERTIAVVFEGALPLAERLTTWLPELQDLPPGLPPSTIALLSAPGGERLVTVFTRRTDVPLPPAPQGWYRDERGPFTVTQSFPLPIDIGTPLSRDTEFQKLTRDRSAPQVFLSAGSVPETHAFRRLLSDAQAFVLRGTGSSLRLSWTLAQASGAPLGVTKLPFPPLLQIKFSDDEIFRERLSGLPEAERMVAGSVLATEVAEELGEDASSTFDILPLLEQGGEVLWVQSNGELRFLLRGEGAIEDLDRLHASFAAALPAGKIETRTFKEGYVAEVVRSDERRVREETVRWNGWDVRTTEGSGRSFVTAVRGEDVILTNSGALLQTYLQSPLEQVEQGVLLRGNADVPALRQIFLKRGIGFLIPDLAPLIPPNIQRLEWTEKRSDGMAELELSSTSLE